MTQLDIGHQTLLRLLELAGWGLAYAIFLAALVGLAALMWKSRA